MRQPDKNRALVVGDTGIIGRHIVAACNRDPNWTVVGLSRGSASRCKPDFATSRVRADLANYEALRSELVQLKGITHLFYAARSPRPDPNDEAQVNGDMFRHALAAVVETQQDLRHVHLIEGMKWYGSHLGEWKTPARESDPRGAGPNMYFEQEDELVRQAATHGFEWSALRPHQIAGFASHYPHNIASVLAAYGSLCKASGEPMRFPGSSRCYKSISMITDADLLAKAALWSATAPEARNQAFNITNGDTFRWEHVWPELGEFFGVDVGPAADFSLVDEMSSKHALWRGLQREHNLDPIAIEDLVDWRYGDFSFAAGADDIASTVKIRRAGFEACMDSHDCLIATLSTYRERRVIP